MPSREGGRLRGLTPGPDGTRPDPVAGQELAYAGWFESPHGDSEDPRVALDGLKREPTRP